MFGKNLKYFRLKKGYSKAELARKAGLSAMAITHYENESRRPDMATIKNLAEILEIHIADFLNSRNSELVFSHAEFRKSSRMGKKMQEYVRESVEEYFGRFFTAVDILGGEVLPNDIQSEKLEVIADPEDGGERLRRWLGISEQGPVGNLIEILENKGILVFMLEADNSFSGMNGTVNGRPYIALNRNMSTERIRTTAAHELAHIAFQWDKAKSDASIEKEATAVAGAFLFPYKDALRELGIRRRAITKDMYMVCQEYGISMSLLAVRAHIIGIISDSAYRNYFISCKNSEEQNLVMKEEPKLFSQLVYRAVSEEEISVQKGAELLKVPYEIVEENCGYLEVGTCSI